MCCLPRRLDHRAYGQQQSYCPPRRYYGRSEQVVSQLGALYTLSLIVSLYTFILSGLFIAGFGLYVLAIAGFRLTRSVSAFAISSAFAMLAFSPWMIVLFTGRNNVTATTSWTNSKLSLFELVRAWAMGVVRLFFDINNQSGDAPTQLLPVFIVLPLLSVLVGYSLYFVRKSAPRRASLFIFCLIGSSILPLALADLVNSGTRISAAQRYLIPGYLGLQLSVAFMLAHGYAWQPGRAAANDMARHNFANLSARWRIMLGQ